MNNILPILMALIPAVLFSNPLPLGGPGKTIVPFIVKSSGVRLEEEHISIKVGVTREIPGFTPNSKMKIKCVSYSCTYYLYNSGSAKKMNIGFPFYSGRTSGGEEYGAVDDFKVSLDDRRIDSVEEQHQPMKEVIIFKDRITGTIDDSLVSILLKKKSILEIPGQPEMYDFSPLGYDVGAIRKNLNKINYDKRQKALLLDILKRQADRGELSFVMYRSWYYFPVLLNPKATHKLVITYSSSNGNYKDRSFYYVLRSARLWNGTVGRCIVDIDFLDNNMKKYSIRPESYKNTGGNAIRFEWNNFFPLEDIVVRFVNSEK